MSQLTPAQEAAVRARGNVLVVAGAGTGKTRTLVDRCVALLEAGESLEHLLVVTFTDAAAAEMRQRIREAVLDRLGPEGSPRDKAGAGHWERQVALLDTAWISTLHSVCLELARRHFHELAIDPEVSVLDDAQTRPVESATLEALFERHSAESGPMSGALRRLIRRYGDGRAAGLHRLMLRIHRYSQTLPDPVAWVRHQRERFAQAEPAFWQAQLVEAMRVWKKFWQPELVEFAGTPNVAACLRALEKLPETLSLYDGATALDEIQKAADAPWPRGSGTKVRARIPEFFDEAEFLQTQAGNGAEGLAEDWAAVRGDMGALLDLAGEFTADFGRAKRALGGVDFSDLEQLALRLLWNPDGTPSAIARQWRAHFHFVFVDEYQDINAAQEALLRALSRDGAEANRFLVGDVKQSIYRFRLANPGIFARCEREWRAGERAGRCIDLPDNFRSREGLLDFVNSLFAALMRDRIGGIEYGLETALRFGDRAHRTPLERAAGAEPRVHLHLLSRPASAAPAGPSADSGSEPLDERAAEREARFIARRLRQLREEAHPVWDPAQRRLRAVEWRDMAVLLRSPASCVDGFAKEFQAAGVPLVAVRGGFYRALEISDLLSLLKILDNPWQDLPLLAVLRSPLVGMSLDELASIRINHPARPFWSALRRFCEEPLGGAAEAAGASARSKAAGFLAAYGRWREQVRLAPLSHCLESVLQETHYEALLLAEPGGRERMANIRRLIGFARQYDPYQRQGLYRFLRFIAVQEEEELDLEPARIEGENAVELLSIHRSKGLEFPVVVLAGLGSPFNLQDLHAPVLLDEERGLCPKVLAADDEARYPSVAHWIASRNERRERLGEELRLLYVAMTRARDTLLLVGTARKAGDQERWPGEPARHLRDREILSARCPSDWLRLWLPQVTSERDWTADTAGQNAILQWTLHGEDDPFLEGARSSTASARESDESFHAGVTQPGWADLKARLQWCYPHRAATVERAKAAVSALRERAGGESEEAGRPIWAHAPERRAARGEGEAGALNSAEVGTAHHRFLQWVSVEAATDVAALRREAKRLEDQQRLSPGEVAALDFGGLAAFWSSAVGERIRAHAGQVRRELPFTARFSPGELGAAGVRLERGLAEDEFVVVQGVIDLALILPDELWVLDFKTDDIAENQLEDRVGVYRPQLALYASALERIYRRPARERWLQFLRLRRTCPV